ncbi:MAG: 4Fe-4S binding protein [Candidatus Geothermincolia bacterium]
MNKVDLGRHTPPWMMRTGIRAGVRLLKLAATPALRKVHPWVKPEKSDVRFLPINSDIEMPEGTPLPLSLLDRFIEEASHRVIFDYCGCRKAFQCESYPTDLGCLLMGEGALEAAGKSGHEVGVAEAKERARRAVEAGLVPIIGKARADNFIFGVKDRANMLTTCFCCECCCISRYITQLPPEVVEPLVPRLGGVRIEVTERCTGCGKCVEHCFVHAMEVVDGAAVIAESCRACGRCASTCPQEAIRISITDPDFLETAYRRISGRVNHR